MAVTTELLKIITTIVLGLSSWTLLSLLKNYKTARQIGLPIIISPVTPLNPFWILTWQLFPPILLLRYLPFGLGTWARCAHVGWMFDDKHALHDEYGDMFIIVTPGGNEIILADPEVVVNVFSRRKEFIKPASAYGPLNVFGPNLITVEGEDWQRHRRLTAPSFNEKTSALVWNETLKQARDMASSWHRKGSEGTRETVSDTATLALHVLTSAGFGMSYPYDHEEAQKPSDGHTMTYRDSLFLCLTNIITFALIPKRVLTMRWVPRKLRVLGQAVQEMRRYMEEMLAHERAIISNRTSTSKGTTNLVSAMVRASEDMKQQAKGRGEEVSSRVGLADEEIFGNIFIYSLAGHETTANTVAFALVLLAAYPKYQEWLAEEIDGLGHDMSEGGEWAYETTFPKLQRCLAVMLETLRLYSSIVVTPKSTPSPSPNSTTPLPTPTKTYTIPPSTLLTINIQALHTDPRTWGPDALVWRPERWLTSHPPNSSHSKLKPTRPGTYVAWADGPRNCPGQKFAQVEFVAVLAVVFGGYRVRPVMPRGSGKGEGGDEGEDKGGRERRGREALLRMVDDSGISAITLQMRRPRAVALEWVRRG